MDYYTQGRKSAEADYAVEKVAFLPALVGLGTAAASYLNSRRFRPSANPALAALQRQAKDTEFQVATAPNQGRSLRSLIFGAKDVSPIGSNKQQVTLLRHTPGKATASGAVDINAGVLPDAMDDKWLFHNVMTQGTGGKGGMPGAVADTKLLSDALKSVRGDTTALMRVMGDKGYVIKPRTGSLSKAENLLTNATDLKDPKLQYALRNPEQFIIQEKLPIAREFRVHMVNNEPVTAAHRNIPVKSLRDLWNKHMGGGGGAFIPATGKTRKDLMEFAREATKHIGDTPEGNLLGKSENFHHGLDIAQLQDGSFRVIESNPVPGTFMNPVVNRKVQEAVTGRTPRDVAALKALALGGASTAATYGVKKYLDKDKEEAAA